MTSEEIAAWGSVVGAGATVAGVFVAWFQLSGIKKGLSMSSLMAVLEIETQMNERKVHFDECSSKVKLGRVDKIGEEALKIRAELYRSAKENYFNALDRLCYCILREYLSDKDWCAEYREYIHNAVKEFEADFGQASPFRNIKKLDEKWQSK